jgi:hypothetical protein
MSPDLYAERKTYQSSHDPEVVLHDMRDGDERKIAVRNDGESLGLFQAYKQNAELMIELSQDIVYYLDDPQIDAVLDETLTKTLEVLDADEANIVIDSCMVPDRKDAETAAKKFDGLLRGKNGSTAQITLTF